MRGDKTGPEGKGPKTGRAMGFCAGYKQAGYLNDINNDTQTLNSSTMRPGRGFRANGRLGMGQGMRNGRGNGFRGRVGFQNMQVENLDQLDNELLKERKELLETELQKISNILEK